MMTIGPAATPAVEVLIEALKDEEELVRSYAAEAPGKIGPAAAPAVEALRAALADESEEVRRAAAEALWSVASPCNN